MIALLVMMLAAGPAKEDVTPTTHPALTACREVRITSTLDGSDQPALIYIPAGAERSGTGAPAPLLVGLHSWSTTYKTSGGLAHMVEQCRQRQWVFIAPNFRGPNKRPEACASKLAIQDILDAVAYARREARIDPDRIYLLGGSGGGHMTLMMAAQAPELWAAASAWVPISDLAAWHRSTAKRGLGYAKMLEACCGGPPGRPETDAEYRRRSPIHCLEKARGLPLDINAGIHDGHTGSVPIEHSLRAFNVLARANGQPDKQLTEEQIREMTDQQRIPAALVHETVDEPSRAQKVLFRRQAGPARITIFEGGHDTDIPTGIAWLAGQSRKRRPASAPGH